ncbi:hypothetical protein [Peribacillus sp. ACCC06369]|jgi:hypothetical protein|nr:hypothetical protein [Peribacillus sp. ACCC06369]MDM5357436.1 hypothetical protein [Peribacillus sp. ACCC06369]
MKEKDQVNQEQEEMERHSLVCNNELFNKDLHAIVDDTMQEER